MEALPSREDTCHELSSRATKLKAPYTQFSINTCNHNHDNAPHLLTIKLKPSKRFY